MRETTYIAWLTEEVVAGERSWIGSGRRAAGSSRIAGVPPELPEYSEELGSLWRQRQRGLPVERGSGDLLAVLAIEQLVDRPPGGTPCIDGSRRASTGATRPHARSRGRSTGSRSPWSPIGRPRSTWARRGARGVTRGCAPEGALAGRASPPEVGPPAGKPSRPAASSAGYSSRIRWQARNSTGGVIGCRRSRKPGSWAKGPRPRSNSSPVDSGAETGEVGSRLRTGH